MPFTNPTDFRPLLRPARADGGLWFVFQGRRLVLTEAHAPLDGAAAASLGLTPHDALVVGELAGVLCLAANLDPDAALPEGHRARDLRSLLGRLPSRLMAVAGRAVQIAAWTRTHRFCGACGTPTELTPDHRARACPSCGHQAFPRLSPAIIVAVERATAEGPELLLARSPHFPPGIHSVLAGFVDPGESAEEAVHREVREETGIEVTRVRYFASQPWPFPNSLMLGFQADYAGGDIVLEDEEIVSAGFYRPGDFPPTFPGRVSISQWLIHDFLARAGA